MANWRLAIKSSKKSQQIFKISGCGFSVARGYTLIKQPYGTVTRCIYEGRIMRYFKKVEKKTSQSGLPGLTLEEKRASEEVRRQNRQY